MKKYFCFLLAGISLAVFSGHTEPVIADVFARNFTSLNGQWNAIVDPYDTGCQPAANAENFIQRLE